LVAGDGIRPVDAAVAPVAEKCGDTACLCLAGSAEDERAEHRCDGEKWPEASRRHLERLPAISKKTLRIR
jgi:hypothetical protein